MKRRQTATSRDELVWGWGSFATGPLNSAIAGGLVVRVMIMLRMYELWFGTFLVEGLLFVVPYLWTYRRAVAIFLSIIIVVSSGWLCMWLGLLAGLPFGTLAIFRVGNLARIIKNRMHADYLKRAAGRTSTALFLFHIVTGVFIILVSAIGFDQAIRLLILVQMLVAGSLLISTVINLRRLRFKPSNMYLSDNELPTVTVAIPARNETVGLQECLNSILANDYPKLEIIVLDDCSQEATADIIKKFAHDGVRFVQGEPPAERWLAKNQAYQQLYEASSGSLILFCGVDVRLGPQTIRSMVNLMYSRDKSMLSVLPIRSVSSPMDAMIQPMRYWWEIAPPRKLFNRPPVLSTCWMIGRDDIQRQGGFASMSHAILPEGFFARDLIKTNKYSFARSSGELDVKTSKSFSEQYKTAIRTRYPQIRRRPEWALLITILNLTFFLSPFLFALVSPWTDIINPWQVVSTCVILTIIHVQIIKVSDPANSLFALLTFPIVAASELAVGYISMVQYEFFTIEWKDRNICIPVMHVHSHLPSVSDSAR